MRRVLQVQLIVRVHHQAWRKVPTENQLRSTMSSTHVAWLQDEGVCAKRALSALEVCSAILQRSNDEIRLQ
jgi:hypothetical protein